MAGKTVEEATEQALDQLGVAVGDAEVIVVDEPKTGLFGRVRVEARVRARVRPVGARPRRERSRRSGGGRSGQGGQGGQGSRQGGQRTSAGGADRNSGSSTGEADSSGSGAASTNGAGTTTAGTGSGTSRSARRRRNRSKATTAGVVSAEGSRNGSGGPSPEKATQRSTEAKETEDMAEGMTLEEQGEVGRAFRPTS